MIKAIEIRLYPNVEQKNYLNNVFGSYRKVYNLCLNKSIEEYENKNYFNNLKDFSNYFHRELLKNEEYSYLKEHNTKILKDSLNNLSSAFKNFFKKKSNLPRFKTKYSEQSIGLYNEAFSKKVLDKNNFIFISKKFDFIKYKTSKEYKEILKEYKDKIIRISLKKTKTNKYFAKIIIDYKGKLKIKQPINDIVGIDLGLKNFIVSSSGEIITSEKEYLKQENRLKRLQRKLSKRIKGSENRNKIKLKIANLHEKIRNLKKEFLHKITKSLVNENQVIVIEDLNVKGMIKNHKLSKSIINNNFGEFRIILKYKCDWYGRELIVADRFYPSSKLCSSCGEKNNELKLSDREWECEGCGAHHGRDFNATLNLVNYGKEIIGRRYPEFTFEEMDSVDEPKSFMIDAKKQPIVDTKKYEYN
jgi:putative transposase